MLAYARSDTHYLLYIYDQLRRDLLTSSKNTDRLNTVLNSSRKQALLTYHRERYDFQGGSGPDGWRKLLQNNKGPKLHSELQLTVFKRLHRWRDQIAREEDESIHYVLPNRSLMNLAASLPHNMQSVVAACHPVPPLVQVYAEDIAYIVAKTRKELVEAAEKAESQAAEVIQGNVETTVKNGVTGSTHVWYKDENLAPNGVRSVMEAIQHGTQFDIWTSQKDKLHSLILPSSKFWEPLKREYVIGDPLYEVGGELEDIKLSVPLPPLTAQIYMTAEDVKIKPAEERDNIAALAQHPFVQRSKEEREQSKGEPEIIIARKLGKKEKKRGREDTEKESLNGDTLSISADDVPIRTKSKSKRRKGLKDKVEATTHVPVEQFDPYKIEESSHKVQKSKGQGGGKSMTFVAKKG
jgi:exosome complex exonuclease RRP6